MPRKSLDERLAEITRKQNQLEAERLATLAIKKVEERKRDDRRKYIVGGAILTHAKLHPAFADQLRAVLNVAVIRQADRAAIADLLPSPSGTTEAAA